MDRVGTDELGHILVSTIEGSSRQNAQGIFATRAVCPGNVRVIEAGDQDARCRAGLLDDVEHPFDQSWRAVRERLDLDVHQPIVLFRQEECLSKRGDGHPAGTVACDRRRIEVVERAE